MDMPLQAGMPDYQREQPEQQVALVAGRRDRDNGARQLFLDAGRLLMLCGWAALAAASTAGPKNDDGRPDASSAVHELLAFVLWLIGVCLVVLVHVERRRFPQAARVGGAAANAVVHFFFVPP